MLRAKMNEPSARPDPKLCPICKSKIPFSLALHMVAAHSPEAKERMAEEAENAPHDARDLVRQNLAPQYPVRPPRPPRPPRSQRQAKSPFPSTQSRGKHRR